MKALAKQRARQHYEKGGMVERGYEKPAGLDAHVQNTMIDSMNKKYTGAEPERAMPKTAPATRDTTPHIAPKGTFETGGAMDERKKALEALKGMKNGGRVGMRGMC
jgi:hypothetical protein